MLMSLVLLHRSISTSNFAGILSIAPVVADTDTGSSVSTMQHRSRILSIRFFILHYLRVDTIFCISR